MLWLIYESGRLPHRQDTLMGHAMCAYFQACSWNKYLEKETDTPNPEGHRWMIEDGQLVSGWIQGLSVGLYILHDMMVKADLAHTDCSQYRTYKFIYVQER